MKTVIGNLKPGKAMQSQEKKEFIQSKFVELTKLSNAINAENKGGELGISATILYASKLLDLLESIYDEGFVAGMKVEINTTKN